MKHTRGGRRIETQRHHLVRFKTLLVSLSLDLFHTLTLTHRRSSSIDIHRALLRTHPLPLVNHRVQSPEVQSHLYSEDLALGQDRTGQERGKEGSKARQGDDISAVKESRGTYCVPQILDILSFYCTASNRRSCDSVTLFPSLNPFYLYLLSLFSSSVPSPSSIDKSTLLHIFPSSTSLPSPASSSPGNSSSKYSYSFSADLRLAGIRSIITV
jgi:hypothetical protein